MSKPSNPKLFVYPGKQADVQWDERLCIHVGECGRSEGTLFAAGRKPWCEPDETSVDDVADVIRRCPSGALSAVRHDGQPTEQLAVRNRVTVSNHGPLYFDGQLAIEGAAADMPSVEYRAALCRCGQSKNKPFCDNAHEKAEFRDRGAIGERGPGLEADGGVLKVRRAPNGPLLLSGNFALVASSGRVAWRGTKAALCRCGASNNKPFCDGSHQTVGFEAD